MLVSIMLVVLAVCVVWVWMDYRADMRASKVAAGTVGELYARGEYGTVYGVFSTDTPPSGAYKGWNKVHASDLGIYTPYNRVSVVGLCDEGVVVHYGLNGDREHPTLPTEVYPFGL